jgi:hypothetical protein
MVYLYSQWWISTCNVAGVCVCARARVCACLCAGGTISAEGQYTPYLAYTYAHGKMFNNLLAARCVISDI